MEFQGGIQSFGEKYGFKNSHINRLQLGAEELVFEMLNSCYGTSADSDRAGAENNARAGSNHAAAHADTSAHGDKDADSDKAGEVLVHFSVEYAETTKETSIRLVCGGKCFNPFDLPDDDDVHLGVTIVKRVAGKFSHNFADGKNEIEISL